jgi:hypothetical protein
MKHTLYILLAMLITAIIFVAMYKAPEIPNIDGVMMRNEAQMNNGYNK